MGEFLEIGDKVKQLDCSSESKALASLKKRLAGRVGVVVRKVDALHAPDMPYEFLVRFPRDGRKSEVVLDLHFSVLIKK